MYNTQTYNTAKIFFLMGICTHIWAQMRFYTGSHRDTYKHIQKMCCLSHKLTTSLTELPIGLISVHVREEDSDSWKVRKAAGLPCHWFCGWQNPQRFMTLVKSTPGLCPSIKCLSSEAKDSSGGWLSSFWLHTWREHGCTLSCASE